nr:hypothetical protein [Tanacetum cinerariifolium]
NTKFKLYETFGCLVTILNTLDIQGVDQLRFLILIHKPVVTKNQSNGSAGKARVETVPDKDYILLPLWTQDLLFSSSSKDSPGDGFKPSGEEEKKDDEDLGNEDNEVLSTNKPRVNQQKDANVNITNNINTVSPTANAAGIKDNVVDKNIVYRCVDDLNTPNLEEIVYSDDDEDVGAEADMTNLNINISVSLILTTRIHKDHPVKQIIRDIHSGPQTRRMKKSMDVKSAFLYDKIEEEVYVCQPTGFEDLEFLDRVYKVEKALYGVRLAPRACQNKHADKFLKKFGFSTVKITSTPMETSKPLMKDENAEDVDVHLFRSLIGLLMYLTSSRPDIMFVVCACAGFQVTPKVSHLYAMKRIFRYLKGQPKLGLWYPKDSPFSLEAYTDSDDAGAS